MYCLVWDFSRNAPCFLVRPANHYTISDHHAGNIVRHANHYTIRDHHTGNVADH